MDEARNPYALQGGAALRFQIGLSRPSTDLQFEGGRAGQRPEDAREVARKQPRLQNRAVSAVEMVSPVPERPRAEHVVNWTRRERA